jgi:hypothetical protein
LVGLYICEASSASWTKNCSTFARHQTNMQDVPPQGIDSLPTSGNESPRCSTLLGDFTNLCLIRQFVVSANGISYALTGSLSRFGPSRLCITAATKNKIDWSYWLL